MLRAFQTASAAKSILSRRSFSLPRAKSAAKKLIMPAFCFFAMFFLMHAGAISGISPLAPAFLAAALACGIHPAALCLGCMAGMVRLPLHTSALVPAIACAIALLGELALSFIKRGISPETRCAALSGVAVMLPALFFARGEIFASVQAIIASAIAAAASPFFLWALETGKKRKRLMIQEKTGLFLLISGIIGGIQSVSPAAAAGTGIFIVLALSPMGASAGIICGLGRILGGAEPASIAGIALAGFASGWKIYRRNPQRAACVSLVSLLATFSAAEPVPSILSCLVPAIVYALLPEKVLDTLSTLYSRPEDANPDRTAREIRDESVMRLTYLAEAFGEMAASCEESEPLPDEQALISEMRSRLCSGCAEYPACWNGGDNHAVHFLCALIGEALNRTDAPAGMRVIFSDGEIPPEVMRFCRRGRMIPDRLGLLLRDFAEKRRSVIKRSTNNRNFAAQLIQAREILLALAEKQSAPVQLRGERLLQLEAALEKAQLTGCEVSASDIKSTEIRLRRTQGEWTPEEVRRASSAFSQAIGGDFRACRRRNTLYFAQKPCFEAQTGVSCRAGTAGQISGDSHLLRMLNPNQLAIMLSDGMGSGDGAARESAEALKLLWKFMNAGIARPLAIETVNKHMLLRTGDEIYATADICIIDLNTGTAEFSKLAACRTLILRGSEIITIEGGNLPLGILERVQPSVQKVRLKPNDTVIIASDGVLEAMDAPSIHRLLRANAAASPDVITEEMVREASLRRSHSHSDDMTCICVRIRESAKGRKKRNMA